MAEIVIYDVLGVLELGIDHVGGMWKRVGKRGVWVEDMGRKKDNYMGVLKWGRNYEGCSDRQVRRIQRQQGESEYGGLGMEYMIEYDLDENSKIRAEWVINEARKRRWEEGMEKDWELKKDFCSRKGISLMRLHRIMSNHLTI